MRFSDPEVQAVFADYRVRAAHDQALMASLGPAGFARRDEFLLPVGEEVGWLLHALIVARRPKRILELGTSYGYSTLFLADAARAIGAQVVTMELADYKQAYSREALTRAGLIDVVDYRCGDALELLEADKGEWDFVLLDIWKDLYVPCFEAVYPQLAEEAVLCSDNMVEPKAARPNARALRAAIGAKGDVQTVLLPVGQGVELSVRWSPSNNKL
ncbi:MAG: class I SAM-dependent methyltransferase [Erythrobacter sp.]|nr:MAG: class I SAM-dependent methyltransferase [Erythrobacter sp.]